MKKKNILIFALAVIILQACQERKESYRENLGVVSSREVLDQLIEASPEKQLVDLEAFIPGIALDIRYATTNNFTGEKIYKQPKAYLRLPVAKALKTIQEELNEQGLALKILDAYRPYSATLKFYEVYPDTNFVAAPWHGSRHNRGCAVDVMLIDQETGRELPMPTSFDDFSERAGHSFSELPDTLLQNRKRLKEIMTRHGFSIYQTEWWHYDFDGWENFELLDIPFEKLN